MAKVAPGEPGREGANQVPGTVKLDEVLTQGAGEGEAAHAYSGQNWR